MCAGSSASAGSRSDPLRGRLHSPTLEETPPEEGYRMEMPSKESIEKMWRYAEKYAEKSGTSFHPDRSVTEAVILGLARHVDEYGRPLCPCNFYPEKNPDGTWPEGLYLPKDEEVKRRTWICACDEMQIYKYCHCLLFVTPEGLPITEYLPEDHEGRQIYGLVKDPTPGKGRALAKALEKQHATDRPS